MHIVRRSDELARPFIFKNIQKLPKNFRDIILHCFIDSASLVSLADESEIKEDTKERAAFANFSSQIKLQECFEWIN